MNILVSCSLFLSVQLKLLIISLVNHNNTFFRDSYHSP